MEIRVGAAGAPDDELTPLAVTMRTPGHDFELATGFVISEGVASSPADIRGVAYCGLPPDLQEYNVVTVRLGQAPDLDRHRRNSYMTSSCGVCGKASIDAVEVACHRRPVSEPVSPAVIAGLTEGLGERQRWFATTGGLHAAGLFDLSGTPLVVREDVGRHNAVDKVIGWAAMAGALPADRPGSRRVGPGQLRDRAEGGGGGHRHRGGGFGAVVTGDRRRPQAGGDAGRLRQGRSLHRLRRGGRRRR